MELGCFLAGALLSSQGHMVTSEVMSCIEPIRDFLAIIFFASIGEWVDYFTFYLLVDSSRNVFQTSSFQLSLVIQLCTVISSLSLEVIKAKACYLPSFWRLLQRGRGGIFNSFSSREFSCIVSYRAARVPNVCSIRVNHPPGFDPVGGNPEGND